MVSPVIDRRLGLAGNTGAKAPVTVVATSNITLSGEQTISSVALLASNAAGVPDRVLATAQTNPVNNGIWEVQTGTWVRADDANGTGDLVRGTQVRVAQGVGIGSVWTLTSADPIVVGTSSQTWTQDAAATESNITWSPIISVIDSVLTAHSTLQAAVTTIGSNRCTVVVRDDLTMTANATFPSTAVLEIQNNARITTTGYTLTAKIRAGRQQWVSGAGSVVVLDGSDPIVPQWWGAAGDGVADDTAALKAARVAALASKQPLYIPGGTYLLTGEAGSDTYANGLLVPFGSVNADPSDSLLIYGDGGRTRLKCNADNMVLLRISRNCVTVRDLCLDANSRTGVILCGVVPESMTQTTTLVSQSSITLENVDRIGGTGCDGLVFQPGPHVGGSDSGCFYHNIIGGWSNFVGGGRHVHLKKNADYGTNPIWVTRTNFIGQRLLRGNAGYHFEEGSEINLIGCTEELIANGTSPLATPTARDIAAACDNIMFIGGYSEGCSKAVTAAANNITSFNYIPASGSDLNWRSYATAWADAVDDDKAWTPVVVSSGGGAEGASTSTGRLTKHGKIVHFVCQVSAAKGTLGAGNVSVSGLPFVADSNWTGADFQGMPCTKMDGITLGTNNVALVGYMSGASLVLRKVHGSGAGMSNLTVADCGATIIFTIQGWYKAA